MTTQRDGRHDFDFLLGAWKSHYKVLRTRLKGAKDWYEFDGTNTVRSLFEGTGNIEEAYLDRPTGRMEALTLRIYSVQTHEWRLYYGSTVNGMDAVPQVGFFDANGVGEFFANDTWDGKPVIVRYHWEHPNAGAWHFEQAFSPDHGKTWETNWISDALEKTG